MQAIDITQKHLLCVICTRPAARDGMCSACLRLRAFSKHGPMGCICPVGAAAECHNPKCPRSATRHGIGAPKIADIQRVVAEAFDISLMEMKSQRRGKAIARPSQVAMFLAGELTQATQPTIGRLFGGRDHTTVTHARAKIRELIEQDVVFAALVERLRLQIGIGQP